MTIPPRRSPASVPPMPPAASPATKAKVGALVACVGAGCAALLFVTTPQLESSGTLHLKAYHGSADRPGVWTICDGDTEGVGPDTVETVEGCKVRLERQLVAHAAPVIACAPSLRGHVNQLWAAVDLNYNVGAFCASSARRLFESGTANWPAACQALMLYDKVTYSKPTAGLECVARPDGKGYACVIPGLKARRIRERDTCLRDLPK